METKKIFNLMFKMSSLQRYSQIHLNKPENVLEHTGFVAMLAMMLMDDLDLEPIVQAAVLQKALCHDMDEIITGDISRTTKYANADITNAIANYSDESMRNIVLDIDLSDDVYNAWRDAKEKPSGLIVKCCDHIAVVYKLWMEVELFGNKAMFKQVGGLREILSERLNEVEEIFDRQCELAYTLRCCILIVDELEGEKK